jgi:hypothetical protein
MLIASCRFLNKIGDKVKKAGERIDDEMDRIQAGVARLPTAIRYTYNPKSVCWSGSRNGSCYGSRMKVDPALITFG